MRIEIPQELPRRREVDSESRTGKIERVVPETPLQRRLPSLQHPVDKPKSLPTAESGSSASPRHACPFPEILTLLFPAVRSVFLSKQARSPSGLKKRDFLPKQGDSVLSVSQTWTTRSTTERAAGSREILLICAVKASLRHNASIYATMGRGEPSRRTEVVTLTREGRNVLLKQGNLAHDQKVYSGLDSTHARRSTIRRSTVLIGRNRNGSRRWVARTSASDSTSRSSPKSRRPSMLNESQPRNEILPRSSSRSPHSTSFRSSMEPSRYRMLGSSMTWTRDRGPAMQTSRF